MPAKKGQVVPVEIVQIELFWTCPNCNTENYENSKRNGSVEELECVHCKTVIKKKGEAQWFVE